jgi:hypothetical protein
MAEQDAELSSANQEGLAARVRLLRAFEASQLPKEELNFNLGLFVRSSVLVKFIVMSDLYKRFVNVPGLLVEFGTWWGQNLVLLENLRAIYEPFNKQRHILGFDTFDGYPASDRPSATALEQYSGYRTGSEYKSQLEDLLRIHEECNAFGHINGNHSLIAGDVRQTAPDYFNAHPEAIVAFAFFDMGPYEATKSALQAIKPHLVSGSVLCFDELTWKGTPGEAVAFRETFEPQSYHIEKCALYPSKAIVTVR